MDKKQERTLKEMRRIEVDTSLNVKKMAEKINRERREKIEKNTMTEYASKHKTQSFVTDLPVPIKIREHTKNGSVTECA